MPCITIFMHLQCPNQGILSFPLEKLTIPCGHGLLLAPKFCHFDVQNYIANGSWVLHLRLLVASGALWNAMFHYTFCTSAVIGRCVASYVIKFERLVFHVALLSLLAMFLSACLHEIHNVVVIPTPLLTLCYGWRVGFVQADVSM